MLIVKQATRDFSFGFRPESREPALIAAAGRTGRRCSDREHLHVAAAAPPTLATQRVVRITVPVPTASAPTIPTGRQCRMLKPYHEAIRCRSPQAKTRPPPAHRRPSRRRTAGPIGASCPTPRRDATYRGRTRTRSPDQSAPPAPGLRHRVAGNGAPQKHPNWTQVRPDRRLRRRETWTAARASILLIRENMLRCPRGGILEMRSREPTVGDDLPPWCRMVGHDYLGRLEGEGCSRYFVRRGRRARRGRGAGHSGRQGPGKTYEWRAAGPLHGAAEEHRLLPQLLRSRSASRRASRRRTPTRRRWSTSSAPGRRP